MLLLLTSSVLFKMGITINPESFQGGLKVKELIP